MQNTSLALFPPLVCESLSFSLIHCAHGNTRVLHYIDIARSPTRLFLRARALLSRVLVFPPFNSFWSFCRFRIRGRGIFHLYLDVCLSLSSSLLYCSWEKRSEALCCVLFCLFREINFLFCRDVVLITHSGGRFSRSEFSLFFVDSRPEKLFHLRVETNYTYLLMNVFHLSNQNNNE